MTQSIRYTLLSLRDLVVSVGPFIVLTLSLLTLAYWWLDPNPPKRVTLATGPAQSAYAEFGKRYAKALAKDGITVELLPTEGSADNLRLLREGRAEAADAREAVFDRFVRLPNSHGDGCGLGLAIVREIASSCHGRAVISDALSGSGTRVEVTFPREPHAAGTPL